MNLLGYISDAGIFVLTGFLAVSGWLAGVVDDTFSYIPAYQSHITSEMVDAPNQEKNTEEIENLPSKYEPEEQSVPDVLTKDPAFQQAAALEGLPAPIIEEPAPELPLRERVENAIVNILCIVRTDERVRTVTGSGVFINPNGVILTNAHVAQFLLLETIEDGERDTRCIVREGEQATARYEAELLYISPAWIQKHAELIDAKNPTGTGERDYALLYVSEALTGELPAAFPFLSPDVEFLAQDIRGTEILVAGYPAPDSLQTEKPEIDLAQVIASSTINRLFTFNTGYADLFSIAGSEAGGDGISGGPIVRADGKLIGLVVTRSDVERDGENSLRAITLSYIDRTVVEETGFSLSSTIAGNLPFRGQVFKEALVPFLASMLDQEFN